MALDRAAIVAAALPALRQGQSTDLIAEPLGITGRTLRNWLIADAGESANEARAEFLSNKVAGLAEEIENATDAFPLARAREAFKSWSWIAERRLQAMFGPKQDAGSGSCSIQVVNYNVVIAPQNALENGAAPRTDVMSNDAIRADATVIDVTPLPSSGK